MPRERTGTVYVEWHGDHFDFRFDVSDGAGGFNRTRRKCMPRPTPERGETVDMARARAKGEAKSEATRLKLLAERLGGHVQREAPEAEGESMDRWVARWLAERKERGLTSAGDDEGRWRKWLFPHLGARPIASVERQELERVVEALDAHVRAGALSWKTARHVWGLVTKMFSDAQRSKRIDLRVRDDNPAKDVRGPDAGAVKAKAYLYPSELLAVLSCATVPLRWKRLFALAVYTYTRPGELEALEWSDVDLERGTIHVHRAVDAAGDAKVTKTKSTRRIPIEGALVPLLEHLKAKATSSRVVESMPPECDLSKRLRDYLKRAGVTRAELFANDATRKQVTFYDLRASGITWMALRGDEPLRIMQRAGHAEFTTTMGYVREAETLGRTETPFPELPPLDGDDETPADWGALRGSNDPARILPGNPTQVAVSARNQCVPSGIRTRVAALKGLSPGPG